MDNSGKKLNFSKQIFLGTIWGVALMLSIGLLFTDYYLASSLAILILAFLPFLYSFERKKTSAREIVMLAILAAVAAVSRIPFVVLPSVQPTTFVIIISGAVFGKQSGFIVGSLAALVSNLFLGQGPWTPWQMIAWGLIGFCSGCFRNTWVMKAKYGRILFGIVSGFVYGWIMNLWVALGIVRPFNWAEVAVIYSSSFFFDLTHALSNGFFLIMFSNSWIKLLTRFKKKYGLSFR